MTMCHKISYYDVCMYSSCAMCNIKQFVVVWCVCMYVCADLDSARRRRWLNHDNIKIMISPKQTNAVPHNNISCTRYVCMTLNQCSMCMFVFFLRVLYDKTRTKTNNRSHYGSIIVSVTTTEQQRSVRVQYTIIMYGRNSSCFFKT